MNFLDKNKISFNIIEPSVEYIDEYNIELLYNNVNIGHLIFVDIYNDMFYDYIYDQDIIDCISKKYDVLRLITELYINKEYRNNGFGSELLKCFIDNFSNKSTILFACNLDNCICDLYKFYEKFGFKEINDSNYFILDKK